NGGGEKGGSQSSAHGGPHLTASVVPAKKAAAQRRSGARRRRRGARMAGARRPDCQFGSELGDDGFVRVVAAEPGGRVTLGQLPEVVARDQPGSPHAQGILVRRLVVPPRTAGARQPSERAPVKAIGGAQAGGGPDRTARDLVVAVHGTRTTAAQATGREHQRRQQARASRDRCEA